jgi:hypothetical protein
VSWHPLDLVSDQDLAAYEQKILTNFGPSSFTDKRTKALEDWLFPILRANGFNPYRLVTRVAVGKAFGYTGAAFTDLTTATQSDTADDVDLAAVFATPGTDALYIGASEPFRGVFLRMLESVSAVASVLSVAYFNGAWQALTISDGTAHTTGKTLSGGGSVTWTLPVDWQRRAVNGSDLLYWVKLTVTATPTAALAGQFGVIKSSTLRAPATFRTLQLIFQEAPTSADGPWAEKAEYYKGEADLALQRALQICGGEFDTDDNDLIDGNEATQTASQASGGLGGGVALERA